MENMDNTEFFLPPDTISQPKDQMAGYVKIWLVDKETGKTKLIVDKRNLILYSGANVLSNALSGVPNSAINYFYVSYNNSGSFSPPVIDLADSNPITSYTTPFGFLRLPLSFSPSYSSAPNYTNNTSFYTTQVSSATAAGGAAFISGTSSIFECALINAANPSNIAQDTVFSRINFNPILFDGSSSLTVVWGVEFLSS